MWQNRHLVRSRIAHKLQELLRVKREPLLAHAQALALRRRIPYIYFLLCINAWAFALSHWNHYNNYINIGFPVILTVTACARLANWSKRPAILNARSSRIVRVMEITVPVVTVLTAIWALYICHMSFGMNETMKVGHYDVLTFFAMTALPITFLLLPLPRAVVSLLAVMTSALGIDVFLSGNIKETLVLGSMLLGMLTFLFGLRGAESDFARHIEARLRMRRIARDHSRLISMDSVTCCASRTTFFSWLDERAATGRKHMVALIDIRHFRQFNDLHGQAEGDAVLAEIASRLIRFAEKRGFLIARVGGNEFALLADREDCERTGRLIEMEALVDCRKPITLAWGRIVLNFSASVASYSSTEGGRSAYARASYALSQAKTSHSRRLVLFDDRQRSQANQMHAMAQELRTANLENEIQCHFQPIFSGADLDLGGFEALARWVRPDGSQVNPSIFIPCAEQHGIIEEITRIMVVQALNAMKAWPTRISVNINLSMYDISNPYQIMWIIGKVRESGIQPDRLTFEITETLMIEDTVMVSAAIASLRNSGMRIAIDDFGTGYSGLANVVSLRPDVIKLDRSFTANLGQDREVDAVVGSALALCRELEIKSVAEGIETKSQVGRLLKKGCDAFQGFLFSPTLPQTDADNLVASYVEYIAEEHNRANMVA